MAKTTTVGRYLLQRLETLGVKHVFGVPGDYVLRFYDLLVESPIEVVGTCTEAGAGFAADAYARVNGLGAVCVTYCVGGFNTLNSVAGAYAEKSPLIVISGAPGLKERVRSPLLHHRVREFNTQRQIFQQVTVAAEALEDPAQAPAQIDSALTECLRQKRPIYLEIPRDLVDAPCAAPPPWKPMQFRSDPRTLEEALAETAEMLRRAKRPVILAGVEIHRFGLQTSLVKLVESSGLPVAATLLGKSVMRENHPQYIGVYEGAMGREDTRKRVEKADCVLILGAFMTDINLGIYTAHLDIGRTINATSEKIAVKHHQYEEIALRDFIEGLAAIKWKRPGAVNYNRVVEKKPFQPVKKRAITVKRFFQAINAFLDENHLVICDIGDSLFGAADLTIQRRTEFLSPAYYTSMGFGVPAALGAHINKRRLRPLVFVGDGAFQMTGQELSSIVRLGLNPIVFVLNNKGYSTERFINDGPYNNIHNWAYHRFTEVLEAGESWQVNTEEDLVEVLAEAEKHTAALSLVNVHLDPYDRSDAMERLGRRLAQRVSSKK